MAAGVFIERRTDHLARRPPHLPLHVGDLFRPLVDEQHEDVGLGVVGQHRLGHLLQQDRLAGPRRAHDQAALAEADRHDQVDHPHRDLLGRCLHHDPFVGVERREVVEEDPRRELGGILAVDRLDPQEREIAFALLGRPDLTGDAHAVAEAEAADLAGRHVDVVGAR